MQTQPFQNSNRQFDDIINQQDQFVIFNQQNNMNNQINQPINLTDHLQQNIMSGNNQKKNNNNQNQKLDQNIVRNQGQDQYFVNSFQNINPQQYQQQQYQQNNQMMNQNNNNFNNNNMNMNMNMNMNVGMMGNGNFQQMQQNGNDNMNYNNNQYMQMNNNNFNNNNNGNMNNQNQNQNMNNNDKDDHNTSASKDENQKRRRARNDPNNRDYICPCGKSYLSYPALFTHIKQKHGGKAPGKVIRPNSQNTRVGRPPKDRGEEDCDNESVTSNEALTQIDNFSMFIHKISPESFLTDDKTNTKEQLLKCFPQEDFFGEGEDYEDYYKTLYQNFQQILEKGEDQFLEGSSLLSDGLYDTCCNKIFVQFLFKISALLDLDIVREMAVYLCFLRKSLNLHGWDIKKRIEKEEAGNTTNNQSSETLNQDNDKNNNKQPQEEYCAVNGGGEIIDISNEFTTQYLCQYIFKFKKQMENFKLFNPQYKISNVIQITTYFQTWLYYKQYTNHQLEVQQTGDDEEQEEEDN